jgi:uncharacterized protein (DUF58 family)
MNSPTAQSGPLRLLRPDVLARLANLELVARAVVEGFLIGLHRSPQFGFSQEFAEYRPYTEGDDLRFIDWNVYARSEKTYIKRFLGETNSHLVIILDASASMGFGSMEVNKFQYGQFLAASLAFLASQQHDAVGCIIFDDDIREYRAPSTRSGKLMGVLHAIDRAEPARGTNLEKPFQHFREFTSRRGMVVVISDFYCDADEMIEGVRPLAFKGQDIILFQLLDPGELNLGYNEAVLLEDLESGHTVEVSRQFIKDAYPMRIQEHIRSISEAAGHVGADHVLVNTSEPLDQALRNYLTFRQRRR